MAKPIKENQNHCSVDQLPSRKIYSTFNNGKNGCAKSSSKTTEIENILKGKLKNEWVSGDESYAQRITKAWCTISRMNTEKKEKSPPCSTICDYFYYWLGDKLSNNLSGWGTTLQDIMPQIYTKLKDSNVQCEYIPMDTTVTHNLFPKRKIIFDYWHNYKTIWKQLQGDGDSCNTQFDSYLSAAEAVYGQVSANCGGKDRINDDFCNKFRKKFKEGAGSNNITEPSKLKDKATGGGDPPPSSDDEGDEANLDSCLKQLSSAVSSQHSAVAASSPQEAPALHSSSLQEGGAAAPSSSNTPVAPIVSSAVAGIGLPAAVTFLLYKLNIRFNNSGHFINNRFYRNFYQL
ncbi:KIR protein [Plasmodium coatneyi]|uniref:KIR protein n=1 Tax=Plasmodium coatneyi TaxID=208452 RepID=A0A1B1DWJ5_9APIC|nr:KIR protein [Plasmodium coatneyi]ANQ07124.1 KIR protein [Plasmodium coatneyi]